MTGVVQTGKQNIIQAIQTYGRQLFGFIRKRVGTQEDAEDILQEVWYQLSSRPDTEIIDSVSGWLYRVARNKITDSYRKKKEEAMDEYAGDDEEEWMIPALWATEVTNPETGELQALFRETLLAALGELPEKQRNVFVMHELQDISLQEIADREKENIKTIISRKQYAVKYLRTRLEFVYQELLHD